MKIKGNICKLVSELDDVKYCLRFTRKYGVECGTALSIIDDKLVTGGPITDIINKRFKELRHKDGFVTFKDLYGEEEFTTKHTGREFYTTTGVGNAGTFHTHLDNTNPSGQDIKLAIEDDYSCLGTPKDNGYEIACYIKVGEVGTGALKPECELTLPYKKRDIESKMREKLIRALYKEQENELRETDDSRNWMKG